jgi:hypothetical protein
LPAHTRTGGKHYWLEDYLRSVGMSPDRLAYAVVDELVENHVGFVVSEWPRVDDEGRLLFGGATARIGCDLHDLNRHLASSRLLLADAADRPNDAEVLRTRSAAIGDAFGFQYPFSAAPQWFPLLDADVSEWLVEPIDVTAAAREAAKIALLSAVAGPPLTEREVSAIEREAGRESSRSDDPPLPPRTETGI